MRILKKITALLFFIAAILSFLSSIANKNLMFIFVGCCCLSTGILYAIIGRRQDRFKETENGSLKKER